MALISDQAPDAVNAAGAAPSPQGDDHSAAEERPEEVNRLLLAFLGAL